MFSLSKIREKEKKKKKEKEKGCLPKFNFSTGGSFIQNKSRFLQKCFQGLPCRPSHTRSSFIKQIRNLNFFNEMP